MPYKFFELPKYPCERDLWDTLRETSRPIVVYGMGNGADKLIKRLSAYGVEIADFFASDGFVRGHSFHGKRVKSFSEIKEEYSDFIILLSFASNREEVIDLFRTLDKDFEFYVPDMPVADEAEYFDKEFFNLHYGEILEAYEALSDSDSKNLFAATVNYKLTGKLSYLIEAYSEKDEIYSLMQGSSIKALVDVGAYNGDTLREAIANFPNLSLAYAIEPDVRNFKKLQKYSETAENVDIRPINAAAWSENGSGDFLGSGNRNSSVCSTASYQHKDTQIPLIRIDSLTDGKIDYIKYDVEGAEYEALIGSEKIIERDRPVLSVSLYHKSKDIFFIVNYLKKKYTEYDFLLRRTLSVPAWEINLILLPRY